MNRLSLLACTALLPLVAACAPQSDRTYTQMFDQVSFRCPDTGITSVHANGVMVRHAGTATTSPNACLVRTTFATGTVPFNVPGLPAPAAQQLEASNFWPLQAGKSVTFTYAEPWNPVAMGPSSTGAPGVFTETWRVLGQDRVCTGGAPDPNDAGRCVGGVWRDVLDVQRDRQGMLENTTLNRWTYSIDRETGVHLRTKLDVVRGTEPPALPATAAFPMEVMAMGLPVAARR